MLDSAIIDITFIAPSRILPNPRARKRPCGDIQERHLHRTLFQRCTSSAASRRVSGGVIFSSRRSRQSSPGASRAGMIVGGEQKRLFMLTGPRQSAISAPAFDSAPRFSQLCGCESYHHPLSHAAVEDAGDRQSTKTNSRRAKRNVCDGSHEEAKSDRGP